MPLLWTPKECQNSGTKVAHGAERVGWVLGLLLRLDADESLVGREIGQSHGEALVGSPVLQVLALFDVVVEDEGAVVGAGQNQVPDCHVLDLAGGVEVVGVGICYDTLLTR